MPWAVVAACVGSAASLAAEGNGQYLQYAGNQPPTRLPRPTPIATNCVNCGAPHEPHRMSCSYCLSPIVGARP